MTETAIYLLKKLEASDWADLVLLCSNFDKIETALVNKVNISGATMTGQLILPSAKTENIYDNNGILALEVDKVNSVVKVYGHTLYEKAYITPTTYNEIVNSGATVNKTIAVGSNKKFGNIIINQIYPSQPDFRYSGIRIETTTDINNAFVNGGAIYDGHEMYANWTKNRLGQITKKIDTYNLYGMQAVYGAIEIISCYIDGTDLKIILKNNTAVAQTLSCLVEGYVY